MASILARIGFTLNFHVLKEMASTSQVTVGQFEKNFQAAALFEMMSFILAFPAAFQPLSTLPGRQVELTPENLEFRFLAVSMALGLMVITLARAARQAPAT